jgi:hypothetical protein
VVTLNRTLRAVGGIGFVAAFVAGAIAYGSGAGTSNAEIAAYYASHGWGTYARWFALAGILVVVALATSYWYLPLFVFLAWVALAAVLRPRRPTLAG